MSVLVHCHLDDITKPITVDGEEIMLRIEDTVGEDRFYTFDSTLCVDANVSWSFECCIKDIQKTFSSFIHRCVHVCKHLRISSLPLSIGDYDGL